ncbi:paired amphipathic helix protein Sin3-like 1 isoform X2 [Typha angustifolia]|uniref:paired amphipathic helix protein Sin3-like 1 isoform X2 n=1 Tax=Typha angustifolia TaxID=59011 RepID=UPI003C2CD954
MAYPPIMPGNNGKISTDDALEFLGIVRETFQGQLAKYQEFLDIMKDFASKRIDTHEVVLKVETLFCGHPDLLFGFNIFVPDGHEITADSSSDSFEEQLAHYMKNINLK